MANENEMNLGLALGSSNQQQQVESSGAGAGANANFSRSRIDKNPFVRASPLTELVWSTQNGLSIKCAAGCSTCFADNNPCSHFRPHVSPSQHQNQGSLTPAKSSLDENVVEAIIKMESLPVGNVAGTNEGPHNQTTADLLPLLASEPEMLGTKTENGHRLGLEIGLPLKIQEPAVPAHNEDNSKECGSSTAPSPAKVEEIAENDVQDVIAKDAILEDVERESESRMMRVQNREESCNERDEDNSHGSMESCNSANLLSKGNNKRRRFEEQLIIGSKRIKKQSQECAFSTPVAKQDSSFMNWISNMVKGIKPCQEEGHSLALNIDQKMQDKTLNLVSKKLGFQTVFQSLYSQDAKRLETRTTRVENKASKEIILFDKTVSNHDDILLNQKAFGNLWIARFSPKTPSTLLTSNNSDLKSFVASDDASASVSLKQLEEPVALTFSETLKTSCFFCGKRGHELRDCLHINEKQVEGFLTNIRLYQGLRKEAPCLCIKCFQLNHWASECPSTSKRCNKTKESRSDLNLKLKESGNVLFKKKVSNVFEIPKHPTGSGSGKIFGIPKEMFDTIRRLRLSRTDILKWMNSRLPVSSLDGYFIRLRLAKWEEGVGGAGYYVGCITDENPSKGSKKPICVNIGGVECFVESRYISNCDFLEDELIGWWRTMLTSRRRLPIEEELASKLEDRKRLGF